MFVGIPAGGRSCSKNSVDTDPTVQLLQSRFREVLHLPATVGTRRDPLVATEAGQTVPAFVQVFTFGTRRWI